MPRRQPRHQHRLWHATALSCVLFLALALTATASATGRVRLTLGGPGRARAATLAGTVARSGGKASTGLSTTLITFAPIHGDRAGTVQLATFGCGKGKDLTAQYSHTRGTATLTHDYQGTLTSCHLNPTFTAGTITAHWSTALRLDLTLTASAQPKIMRTRASRGCYTTTTTVTARATGRFSTAIHETEFGTLHRSVLSARITQLVLPACLLDGASSGDGSSGSGSFFGTGTAASLEALENGTDLEAAWGRDESLSALAVKGRPSTVSFSEPVEDGPTPTVTDTFGLELRGGGDFGPAKLTGAGLDFASPVSSGTLTFTVGIGCPPTVRANDGTLAGDVTIDDPVLGTVHLTGAEMGEAQISIVDSDSYKCSPSNLI